MNNQVSIGVDIGATKIAFAIVDSDGNILHENIIQTNPSYDVKTIQKDIVRGIQSLQHHSHLPIKAVGIGIAGQVEPKTGMVHFAPNLRWHHVPLKANLEKELGLPVTVMDDVRAATLGEWHFGAGKGYNDFVCLLVGTGIGGGIVSKGSLIEGHSNCAGELGHMTIMMNGPICSCGNRGCFEALAGGWAIAKKAQEAISKDYRHGKILLEIAKTPDEITAKTVVEAFFAGDPLSKKIMDETTEALIAGCISIVNGLNPQRLILSGGIILGVPDLIDAIEHGVRKYALKAATHSLEIVPSELQNNAGVIGASRGSAPNPAKG